MKTECPHCGQHYEVDEEYIGQIAKCISCNQEFVIEKISSDVAIQENFVQKQPTETSTENNTIEKESVINKPEYTEKVNAISKSDLKWKTKWTLRWLLFIGFIIFYLADSCSDSSKTPERKGPPTAAEWSRYMNKIRAEQLEKEQKLWNDIRNY
jgi:predicted Zn finger-like uncharacterized protein